MAEKIQCWVVICWYWDHVEPLLILIGFTEVYVYQDIAAFVIDDNVRPFQDAFRIKITVFWDNICLPEQAVEGHKEGTPQREILNLVDVNLAVHAPQDCWLNWEDKLWCTLQPSFYSLKGCFKSKVIGREVITHGSVNVFDTAQNILAVAVGAGVGHQLHEHTQTVWQGWQGLQAEEVGKIKPLPDVRQDVAFGRGGKAKAL